MLNKDKLTAVKASIIEVDEKYKGKNIASIVAKDLQFYQLCDAVEYFSEFVQDKCTCHTATLVMDTGEPYKCSACRCIEKVWGIDG